MPIHNSLRFIYGFLGFTILFSFSGGTISSAHAQKTIHVVDTVVMTDATCPSGFSMDFLDGRFCIDGKPQKIQKHLGPTKVAYSFHKKVKFQGKKFPVYRIESYSPKQAAGTSYETRGGLQSFIEVVGAVSAGINAANGVYTPPPVAPTPAYVPPKQTPQASANNARLSTTPATLTYAPLTKTNPSNSGQRSVAAPVSSASTTTSPTVTLPTANASDLGTVARSPGYCESQSTTANYSIVNNSFHNASVTVQIMYQVGGVQSSFVATQVVNANSNGNFTQQIPCSSDNVLSDYGKVVITAWQFY